MDLFLIYGRVDIETAWGQAAFHLAVETRPGSGSKILGSALAKLERFVDDTQRFAHGVGRCEWAEIERVVPADLSNDRKIRIVLFKIDSQRRIALIVF